MISRAMRISIKRVIDTTLIILFLPIIILAIAGCAVAVVVSMGRPVLFTQRRIGLNEQPFSVLKFRTMSDARDDKGLLLPDQERLTKAGRVLRKLSLDELPQLINVLRGEMALVGPRPLLNEYLPFYREHERLRHSVRPGITGAAQVAGRNGLLWDARLSLDAKYAESATIMDDLKIIIATVRNVFSTDGVSVIAGDSGERLDVVRSYPSEGTRALRRLEVNDAETRVSWFEDPRTASFMNVPQQLTVEGTKKWIRESRENPARKDFVLYDFESPALLGMAGIRGDIDINFPEIHMLIAPDRHGEGLGSLLMRFLLEWLKSQGGVQGCWLTVHPDNSAAVRLYENFGFLHKGSVLSDRITMELKWRTLSD